MGAEYIMRWLPIGTHEWEKFVIPEDLTKILKKTAISIKGDQNVYSDRRYT